MVGCDKLHFLVYVILIIGLMENSYKNIHWFVLEENLKIGLIDKYVDILCPAVLTVSGVVQICQHKDSALHSQRSLLTFS
jgi:hypothetical protein